MTIIWPEEVLAFKIGEGRRVIRNSRIISWLMKVRCRFSQITFRNSRRRCFGVKIPVLEFLFNKFAGLRPSTLLKCHSRLINKILRHRYFLVNFVKFLKTSILQNVCERLLLYFRTAVLEYKRNIHWKMMKSFFSKVYISIKALQRLSCENLAKPNKLGLEYTDKAVTFRAKLRKEFTLKEKK